MAELFKWYTLDDIAEHLALSRDTIIKLVKNDEFPAHRVGNKYRFDIDEVDNWVRNSTAN
jgi:excisionase family DNA binding protein